MWFDANGVWTIKLNKKSGLSIKATIHSCAKRWNYLCNLGDRIPIMIKCLWKFQKSTLCKRSSFVRYNKNDTSIINIQKVCNQSKSCVF